MGIILFIIVVIPFLGFIGDLIAAPVEARNEANSALARQMDAECSMKADIARKEILAGRQSYSIFLSNEENEELKKRAEQITR